MILLRFVWNEAEWKSLWDINYLHLPQWAMSGRILFLKLSFKVLSVNRISGLFNHQYSFELVDVTWRSQSWKGLCFLMNFMHAERNDIEMRVFGGCD